jgi:uncharacterized membrane protein
MSRYLPELCVAASLLVIVAYEVQELYAERRRPGATARSAHRLLRGDWVRALSRQPGTEIVAVQALRNSLMSATITASTAVLVLMGAVTLLAARGDLTEESRLLALPNVLEVALVLTLFATYLCSAMAMRYYHHAGFILSLPVGAPERAGREPLASEYVERAGLLYGWSLRCFMFGAPLVVGLIQPLAMPLASLGLVGVLAFFDRPPPPAAD